MDPRTAPAPDPGVGATITANLARLRPQPAADAPLALARQHLQDHGLAAFFHAASDLLAGGAAPAAGGPAATLPATPTAPASAGAAGGQLRQRWQNCIGSLVAQPLQLFRPATLADLQAILAAANAQDCPVKAVGSGHSFTDVALTRGFLIDTHGLNRPLPLEGDLLRPGAQPDTLFATEAGIVVGDLNDALWAAGLGLENLGGYDGQTIAGVVSTSTHGSGLGFGPLSSQVVSLTLVAGDGQVYRVEPAGGITDPERWAARHPEVRLKQDDDWFRACQVGLGCLGVIYAVVLRVRARYYLEEVRTLSRWSQVARDLPDGQVLRDNRHYEVLVNPYATDGDHTCLITCRNPVPAPPDSPAAPTHRNFLVELAALAPGSSDLLLAVFDAFPALTPSIIDQAMGAIAGDYVDRSYRVFNIGAANDVPAYGSEIGFPLERAVAATERILEITAQRQQVGQAYLSSPFSLRFVRASDAYLSMMEGTDTCMIEFPLLAGTVGGPELLQEIETAMYPLGGRPHWGLLNSISGADGLVAAMYPQLDRWLEVYHQLDPAGRFANAFTERCGLTPRVFQR